MSAETTVNTIISEALSRAQSMTEAAQGYSGDAVDAISEAQFQLSSPPIFSGGPTPPEFTGSLEDPTSTALSNYDANVGDMIDSLVPIFTGFLTDHFPRTDACLTVAEQWLCDTIQNGGTGIPADVEGQIWERARARELADASRREDEATNAFAMRGFTMPPGALSAQLMEIQQDAANKISAHGRDVAVEQAKIAIETVKFAVGEALRYRIAAIQAAIEYWKAYLLPYDIAAKRALAEVDIKTKFYNSALEYFRTRVLLYGHQVQEATNFYGSANAAYMAQAKALEGLGAAKAQAATAAAKAAGDIASAAQSALNTLAQYGYVENKEL